MRSSEFLSTNVVCASMLLENVSQVFQQVSEVVLANGIWDFWLVDSWANGWNVILLMSYLKLASDQMTKGLSIIPDTLATRILVKISDSIVGTQPVHQSEMCSLRSKSPAFFDTKSQ